MTYTLVIYDRAAGRLLSREPFTQRRDALRARFRAERRYRGQEGNIEVVVLAARTDADLVRTHSRYFFSLQELAEQSA
ncbi:hypothetical protein ACQPZF_01085 [Actinosynnema sp. CS-041913]|uniref:hypothetical protein n=1 Tax=Actinosynnema sp. CS-041913 TaxID=3239917 RepID=UPI003D8DF526